MRTLMKVVFPHEPFNSYVRDGSINQRLNRVIAAIDPDAVYFTELEGKRAAMLVVDVPEDAGIPTIAEPLFLQFEADVELKVAMTLEDLGRSGIEDLGQLWK